MSFSKILILGAGRSSGYLIDYLANKAPNYHWKIRIVDQEKPQLAANIAALSQVETMALDIRDKEKVKKLLEEYKIVLSLLPVRFQAEMAQLCLENKCHFLTASYLPPEIKALHKEVKAQGLFFLNEMGLDPGLDHMSACQAIDQIHREGGKVKTFKSFAGALVAPESESNPWRYKFTWNPYNVVRAGQGIPAKLLRNKAFKFIPYTQLFQRTQKVNISGWGELEAYANRDSLKYRKAYQLEEVETMERGTLRQVGFCEAWNALVQLGICEDNLELSTEGDWTYREFLQTFLPYRPDLSASENCYDYLGIDSPELRAKLDFLDLDSEDKIPLKKASPAQILQVRLEEKWALRPMDKDLILMQHQIEYSDGAGESQGMRINLAVEGKNAQDTAIAKTVGLPLALAAELLAKGDLKIRGVFRPTFKEIYEPVLEALKPLGIEFKREVLKKSFLKT